MSSDAAIARHLATEAGALLRDLRKTAPEQVERLGAEAVARGDVSAHVGGQHEWDSAAPVAVARAAGLHASRLDGGPLRHNQPDPHLPDLLICPPDLARSVHCGAEGAA